MIDAGDKVVVTDVPEGCGLVGIEVGSVGEVIKRVDKNCVDILFEVGTQFLGFDDEEEYLKSKNCGHTLVFLVEKFDEKKEEEVMLEVGDKVVVTQVLDGGLDGVEVGKVGEIIAVDCSDYTKLPYLVNFSDCTWWAGRKFLVEKLEDVETGETPSEGEIRGVEVQLSSMQDFAPIDFFNTYIDEKQDTKESDNTSEGGAYNTVIKKDGLTIYTNYSVEVVGESMRVSGVDDLVSDFDDSEDGGGELGE